MHMNMRYVSAAAIATAVAAVLAGANPAAFAQANVPFSAPASTPATAPETVQLSASVWDVLKLSRAKVSDDITVAYIQKGDRRYNLNASEIVYLRNEGVSDQVLAAMLNQPSGTTPAAATAPAPAAAPPAASAPQYVSPPPTTAVVETAPASSVFVIPSSPTYYSFYDPWPYWYNPWPFVSLGFYWGWGGCGNWGWNGWGNWGWYGYGNYYNCNWNDNHCNNGKPPPPPNGHPPPHGNPPPNGNPPPSNGNPPPPGGGSVNRAQSATLAGNGRTPATANPARSENRSSGYASGTPTTRPTSFWSHNGNQNPQARNNGNQANAASTRSSRSAAQNNVAPSGAFTRSVNGGQRTASTQVAAQSSQRNLNSKPTTAWSRNTGQAPTYRAIPNQGATTGLQYSRVNTAPATARSRSSYPSWKHRMPSPSVSYRSSTPRLSSRGGGGFAGASRPSMSSSYSRMGSSSSFRGGGGFSGGSAPRMSSPSFSGGGFRGGGGGGGRFGR